MHNSPLRYPGGKSRLSKWILEIMQDNNISNAYAEPYAGGAGIALNLLLGGYVKKIFINDIDRAIYAIWYLILNDSENFIRAIYDVKINIDEWKKQKTILQNSDDFDDFKVGFAAFFLNRTNVSGIIKGGPIGGILQKGNYKLDARFNKQALINKIQNISSNSSRIFLYNLDACEFVKKIDKKIGQKSLIYLDPPYVKKGRELYMNFYNEQDHITIFNTIKNLKKPWIVSYDNSDFIKNLYSDYKGFDFSFRYFTGTSQKSFGTELMFYANINIKNKF